MASNPVNAFLQGFAVVDRLETNRELREDRRQMRAFREEEQSQLRKVWQRQDDEYARIEKARIQGENLTKLDAQIKQIMLDAEEGDAAFLGDPIKVFNEAAKRLSMADPGFAEAAALSVGLDAAAGTLVRDKTRPVSGFGMAPDGRGLVFEIDSVNGKQPATVNRTSADNDPVFFGEMGMPQLTEMFGAGILTSDLLVAKQLRSMFGPPTGQPFASQEPGGKSTPATKPQGQTDAQIAYDAETFAIEDGKAVQRPRTAATQSEVAGGENEASAVVPGTAGGDLSTEQRLERIADLDKQLAAVQTEDEVEAVKGPLRDRMFDSNVPMSSRIAAGGRLLVADAVTTIFGRPGKSRSEQTIEDVSPTTDFLFGDAINFAGGFIVDTAQELVTGKVPGSRGAPLDDKVRSLFEGEQSAVAKESYSGRQTTDGPATTIKDVVSTGATASDYSRDKLSRPGEAAGQALLRTPMPSSPQAAKDMAQNLSGSTGRPSIPKLYNAVSLTKAGFITPEQLYNYARTGNFETSSGSEFQLFNMGLEGGIVAVNKNDPTQSFQSVPGRGRTEDTEDDIDIFKDQRTLIENRFRDRDGNVDEGRVQRTLEQIETATDVLQNAGLITRKQRTDRSLLSSLTTGQRYVDQFSADPSQTFDFNPFSDPELGPNNMALGYVADHMGVVGQENADRFLFDYGITLRNAAGHLSGEDLIKEIIRAELEVRKQVREQGGDRNETRTRLVKEGLGE